MRSMVKQVKWMNQTIYNSLSPPKKFIDTTVLCGALRTNGINRKILEMGASPHFFKPVVSRVCLLEFYRKALFDGLSGTTYTFELVTEFLDLFVYPILDNNTAVNSLVGRESFEVIVRNRRPIGEVIVELSGCTREEANRIVSQEQMDKPLHHFDENDFHVWVTAIIEKCNFILTNNTKRFPEKIGNITRVKPGDFYNMIMD